MPRVLLRTNGRACLDLGSLGTFCISPSIVLQLLHILEEPVMWKYEFLYVPFFIPFTVVSIVTIIVYWRSYDKGVWLHTPFKEAGQRVAGALRNAAHSANTLQQAPSSPRSVRWCWFS